MPGVMLYARCHLEQRMQGVCSSFPAECGGRIWNCTGMGLIHSPLAKLITSLKGKKVATRHILSRRSRAGRHCSDEISKEQTHLVRLRDFSSVIVSLPLRVSLEVCDGRSLALRHRGVHLRLSLIHI